MDRPTKLTLTRVVNKRRQIYISPAAEKIISSLQPRPVDVVVVVGPIRKGKSHLANLLCKKKSGFPLGDEMESKTKDFWFWIGPHPFQSDRYLMVVDTEGLDDYSDEEHEDKDMKHLVLATLISNHLVFNLQGNPDSGLVNNLRLMGDLAERIRVQKDGSDDGSDLGEHFPELWVAVQDVRLKTPKRNGRRLTPDEFLEMLLEHKGGHTKAIRSHNETTSAVKTFFQKRHLRLIPEPSGKLDELGNLDRVSDSDLKRNYKDAVGSFTREIWNSDQVKRVNGDDITTTGFLRILQYYVDAINDPNAMPSVLGAYEAMTEGECRRASEEQMKTFQKIVQETVKPLMPIDEETCNRKIKVAVETAVTNLSAAVGHWDKDGAWKRGLQEKLERQRRALLEDNDTKSKDLCDRILKKADQTVQQKEEDGVYNKVGGFAAYVGDMNAVYKDYEKNASGKGPAVEKVLENFRATVEATRRNRIRNIVQQLEEEERRKKEEKRKIKKCCRTSEEQMKIFQETVQKTVKPLMPTDEETCDSKIKTVAENAVSNLSAAVGQWDKDETWKKRLQEELEKERQALLKMNYSKSKDLCDKIMKEADQTVQQKEERRVYYIVGGFDTYVKDMGAVYEAYHQNASGKGPAVVKVLETFRTKETTRKNRIRDIVRTREEEDRRVKEEKRKRQKAEEAAERAAEQERRARAEAARAEAVVAVRHERQAEPVGERWHESASKVAEGVVFVVAGFFWATGQAFRLAANVISGGINE